MHADVELALELGADRRIVGYGAALELVDLSGDEDAATIVADNVFHRAVCFGPMRSRSVGSVEGRLIVNGTERARAAAPDEIEALVDRVGALLEHVGETLSAGDRLITGAIVQVPVRPGDHVRADLGRLGVAQARVLAGE